jgi:hypothetical protein
VATVFQFLGVSWLLPLPFQRYYVGLAPFTCLWIAYGIAMAAGQISQRVQKQNLSSLSKEGEVNYG